MTGQPRALHAVAAFLVAAQAWACTIGVASPRATSDGRAMVWKVRDQGSHLANHVVWREGAPYKFLGVANAGDTLVWMGVNEAGFAVVNSNASDLSLMADFTNGSLLHHALGHCASVDDFRDLLGQTQGVRQVHANYAVMDAWGHAAVFEVSDSLFWEYDAQDTAQHPFGFVVRTNFSLAGGGTSGMARYLRANALLTQFCQGDSLNVRTVLRFLCRDFADADGTPIPIPYPDQWAPSVPFGYILTSSSICRWPSVSAVVIQGACPGVPATMWTLLGQPAGTVAVPLWPVGPPPPPLVGVPTAPMCDVATQIRSLLFDWQSLDYLDSYKLRTESGHGLWASAFPLEDSFLSTVAQLQACWRLRVACPGPSQAEALMADLAFQGLKACYEAMITPSEVEELAAQRDGEGIRAWWKSAKTRAGTPLGDPVYQVRWGLSPWSPRGEVRVRDTSVHLPAEARCLGLRVCGARESGETWWWLIPLGEGRSP